MSERIHENINVSNAWAKPKNRELREGLGQALVRLVFFSSSASIGTEYVVLVAPCKYHP